MAALRAVDVRIASGQDTSCSVVIGVWLLIRQLLYGWPAQFGLRVVDLEHTGTRLSLSTAHGSNTSTLYSRCFDRQHGQLILFEQRLRTFNITALIN
jgi:hypothetical protein